MKPLEDSAIDLSLRVAAANAALEFANAKITFAEAVIATSTAYNAMQEGEGRMQAYDEAQRNQYAAWTCLEAATLEFDFACKRITGV